MSYEPFTAVINNQAVDYSHPCCGPNTPAAIAPDPKAAIQRAGQLMKLRATLAMYRGQLADLNKERNDFGGWPGGLLWEYQEMEREIEKVEFDIAFLKAE